MASPDTATCQKAKGAAPASIENVRSAASGEACETKPISIEDIPTDAALTLEHEPLADSAAVLLPVESDGHYHEEAPETEAPSDDGEQNGLSAEPLPVDPKSQELSNTHGRGPSQSSQSSQPAVHRDRRGRRRTVAPPAIPPVMPIPTARPYAEAKLRLSLHPIRQTATLSVVLARPDGFPERVTLQIDSDTPIEAYNAQRYDDLDLPWTDDLLANELRIQSAEGFQWLRSKRQVHIFTEDASEPGLVSVGAARTGAAHAVICRGEDAAVVCAAATAAGSLALKQERWYGVAEGWTILSGYRPEHAVPLTLPVGLRPLDPGSAIGIAFQDGLAIRLNAFAEARPPRIEISYLPSGATVTIGGQPAVLSAVGGWEAPGWDSPGRHMVDVVPGPSLAYEIVADPAGARGWPFWDAHSGRFGERPIRAWARAEICGACVRGPAGEAVLAVEAQPTLIALGMRSGMAVLQQRGSVSVSIALVAESPAFLFSATGQRRSQGRITWLGLAAASPRSNRSDPDWVAAVSMAASRHLPLHGADSVGEQAWRKAKEWARQLRKQRK